MIIQELNCFGISPGGGNAALVIQDDRTGADQRQQLARERNKAACVFIDRDAAGNIVLDYFYPHTRSPLCLHATLAAARVLLSPEQPSLQVRTAMRGQPLTLTLQAAGSVFIELTPQAPPAVAIPHDLPALLLAAPGLRLASPPAVASVGSPKLLLQVADSATLQALQPDLAGIHEWSRRHGVSGCYAWCLRPDGAVEGRNFNHLDPAMEDSATGVAAGALTVHLRRSLALYQGANMNQPCLIRTQLNHETILIGGATEFIPNKISST
jgi:PhzF family phenazine biosynthesis protein